MTTSPPKEDERFAALLGLAASRPEPVEKCPEPELLSAFIENRLSESQHREILDHLDRCECCYREWLAVSLSLEEIQPAGETGGKPPWWQRWRARLLLRPWLTPLTTAVAMTLAVLAVVNQKPASPEWQPRRLAALVENHTGTRQILAQLPQSGSIFAFGATEADPARKAFAAGLRDAQRWLGKETIVTVDTENWQESAWKDYYHLGQWALLAWTLANSDAVSPAEWRAFERHCLALIDRFQRQTAESPPDQLLAELRELHTLLNDLASHPDPVAQTRLVRQLRKLIQQWLV